MPETIKIFKQKLRNGNCLGLFSKTTDSAIVEITGESGLDFIILDMEHGLSSYETIQNHIRAAQLTSIMPIVRVKGVDSHAIGSSLDAGAFGVQIPNISTAEEASEAIKYARFHPEGFRGVCRFVRSAKFGSMEKSEYFKAENEKVIILQVEGVIGIKNIDAILDVPGYDILFVGTYDLSQSLGIPGNVDSPEITKLLKDIAEKAREKGKYLGAFSDSVDRTQMLGRNGYSYIAHSVDFDIILSAFINLRKVIHGEQI